MSMKEQIKALIESVYLAYKNALTRRFDPSATSLTKEEIEARHRQQALRELEDLKNRMVDS